MFFFPFGLSCFVVESATKDWISSWIAKHGKSVPSFGIMIQNCMLKLTAWLCNWTFPTYHPVNFGYFTRSAVRKWVTSSLRQFQFSVLTNLSRVNSTINATPLHHHYQKQSQPCCKLRCDYTAHLFPNDKYSKWTKFTNPWSSKTHMDSKVNRNKPLCTYIYINISNDFLLNNNEDGYRFSLTRENSLFHLSY